MNVFRMETVGQPFMQLGKPGLRHEGAVDAFGAWMADLDALRLGSAVGPHLATIVHRSK